MHRRSPPRAAGRAAALASGLLLAAAAARHAGAVEPFNLELLDHLELGPLETVTDVDVEGGLAFVGRSAFGLTIVDISEPGSMRIVGEFRPPGPLEVNDVQVARSRAYVANQGGNGVAVYILDVSDPAMPVAAGAIITPLLNLTHNLAIDGDFLYVVGHEGARGWRTRIFDVSDPSVPVLLAVLPTPGAHDVTVLDGILYEAGGWAGLHIWDVRDPAHPVHLAEADTNEGPRPHYHCHSVWPTEDRRHILVMNEIEDWLGGGHITAGGVKVFAWDGGNDLRAVSSWRTEEAIGDTLVAVHNVAVDGRHAYLSYYQAGVRVLDIADPAQPVEVGFFDTYPEPPSAFFEGCWGVDLGSTWTGGSPLVYASDRRHGLFQLRFNGARRAEFSGLVRSAASGEPIAGALLRLISAGRTLRSKPDGGFAAWTGEGRHLLEVSAEGYEPLTLWVTLNPGLGVPSRVIELEPIGGPLPAPRPPAFVRLEPSIPNPFRGTAAISFEIGKGAGPAPVRLVVHDVAGRTVRVLLDAPLPPGRHAAAWDGLDERGRPLPSGVYALRLVVGDEERRGRVALLR